MTPGWTISRAYVKKKKRRQPKTQHFFFYILKNPFQIRLNMFSLHLKLWMSIKLTGFCSHVCTYVYVYSHVYFNFKAKHSILDFLLCSNRHLLVGFLFHCAFSPPVILLFNMEICNMFCDHYYLMSRRKWVDVVVPLKYREPWLCCDRFL